MRARVHVIKKVYTRIDGFRLLFFVFLFTTLRRILLVPPSRSSLRSPHGIVFDAKKIDENGAKGTRRISASLARGMEK